MTHSVFDSFPDYYVVYIFVIYFILIYETYRVVRFVRVIYIVLFTRVFIQFSSVLLIRINGVSINSDEIKRQQASIFVDYLFFLHLFSSNI